MYGQGMNTVLGRAKQQIWLLCSVLAIAACTGRSSTDLSDGEVSRLKDKIINEGLINVDRALAQVDSAEQAHLFTSVEANVQRALINFNDARWRMAAYYAEKCLDDKTDTSTYCSATMILAQCASVGGEYGKATRLAKDMLAYTGDNNSPRALKFKCKALTQMAECEEKLNHFDEAERLYLEGINLMMENVKPPTRPLYVDPLMFTLLTATDLYLKTGHPEKALPLMAKADTAMILMEQCADKSDKSVKLRHNNLTILQAIVFASCGQFEKGEALYQRHRQSEGLTDIDIAAEGRYLMIVNRYNEAVRLFTEADSMAISNGEPITEDFIKERMMLRLDALQKAGQTEEALRMSNHIRLLTDSLRNQQHLAEVEQMEEIRQKEELIAEKRQLLLVHRIVLIVMILVCLFVGYMFWRSYKYNKVLFEKNRLLVAKIEQREHEEQQALEQLEVTPEENLTANQQLYRRLCDLMKDSGVFTDHNTNQDTLASLLGTNRTYIYDALRECANQTPADFINSYRLRYAAHLLSTTSDPVSLIAERCGLSRMTLYRLFNDTYSMSPSDYRNVSRK